MVAELGRSQTVKSGLNPLAAEFIPGSSARQAVHKYSSDTSLASDNKGFGQLPDAVSFLLTCLPLSQKQSAKKGQGQPFALHYRSWQQC